MIALLLALSGPTQPAPAVPSPANPTGSPVVAEIDRVGGESATELSFLIGPDGKAADCRIERGSGSQQLDAEACAMLTSRARWTPPAGAGAGSTGARTRTRIVWRIEE